MDLTAITTPFGLLDADTRAALEQSAGPFECWHGRGWMPVMTRPAFDEVFVYRVKPVAVEQPREGWRLVNFLHATEDAAKAFRAELDAANPGKGYDRLPITRWVEVLP